MKYTAFVVRMRLFQFLLDAELVGVSTLLLAAVGSARVETSVAPDKQTSTRARVSIRPPENPIHREDPRMHPADKEVPMMLNDRCNTPFDSFITPSTARFVRCMRVLILLLTCGKLSCRHCTIVPTP